MTEGMVLQVTALWGGLLGLLMVVLAIIVVIARNGAKVLIEGGGNDDLVRKIRVFGNFSEYVPMAILLMAMAELTGAPSLSLNIIGAMLLVGRLMHWHGLHGKVLKPTRAIGVVLTWIAIAGSAGYCILAAV
jgi:uncharacterized membrane protein YecN with MAPEG domain